MEKDASFFFQKKIELLFKQTYILFCCCYWLIFRIPNSINFYPILCSQLNIYIFFSSNWKFPISILNIHPVSSSATTKPNKNKSFFIQSFRDFFWKKNVEILLKKKRKFFRMKRSIIPQFNSEMYTYFVVCLFGSGWVEIESNL